MIELQKERLDDFEEKINEKLAKFAIDEEIKEILATKAPQTNFGDVKRELADLKGNLDILVDKKHILNRLIN